MAGVFISTDKLAELMESKEDWSARSTLIEELKALTQDTANVPAVDNGATVATVITALKTLGIFKDP